MDRLAFACLLALVFTAFGQECRLGSPAHASPVASSDARFAQFEAKIAQTKAAMMRDPQAALKLARAAGTLARTLPAGKPGATALATAQWLEAEALLFNNDAAAALPIVSAALANIEQVNPDSKLHGDLLRSRGAIASMKGDVVSALRDYQQAFTVFQRSQTARSQAIVLQDIGQIYSDAEDYPKVLRYYSQALEAYGEDPALRLTTHNNLAEVYRKQGKFETAESEYRKALVEAKQLDSAMLQVRILTNLAGAQIEGRRYAAAQATVAQALAATQHGEAAGWRPFVLATEARLAADQGALPRAAALYDQTFASVDLAKSDMLFRYYHLNASKVYEATGRDSLALAHFKAFQRLDSEARALTASIASQLAASQFDFANQNLKIAQLKQEKLQKDIATERDKVRTRTILFGALTLAAIVASGALLTGFLSIRRSRNEVRAANASLSASNVKLEKALLAKTEFLAMTSHEIRTPLNGILGMTQVMLADRRVDGELRGRIEVVNSAGETMQALVNDILDVAKMESGELTIVSEPTDLLAILRETQQLWSGQAEARSLRLVTDFTDAPARILGDGGRIRQILFNLMSNALKFTLDGSVTLRAGTDQGSNGSETLRIEVSDTGIGIAADMHEVIFESFKQVDAGTTRQFSGTGLGLAICKRLAEAMGGTITISSEVGVGSTFQVLLPLSRLASDSATGAAGNDAVASLADKAMILALPDGPDGVLVRMALLGEAASLDIVTDLDGCMDLMASGTINHVVFDADCLAECSKPLAALSQLVEQCDAANASLSLLLTRDGPVSPADAMLAGPTQIIVKPIEIEPLIAALSSLHTDQPEEFVMGKLMQATE